MMSKSFAATAAACTLALAACGTSSSGSAPSAAGPSNASNAQAGSSAAGGRGRMPGTRGLIAAVNGTTMQVQSPNAQTAVSWTSSTKIYDTTKADAAAVTAGSCVSARLPQSGAAVSVTVSAPANGACSPAGMGGMGGGLGGGRERRGGSSNGGTSSSSSPSTRHAGGFGAMVFGKVTAVSGSTITVDAVSRGGSSAGASTGGSAGGPAGGPAGGSTAARTFMIGPSTAVTKTAAAGASAITTGECAVAIGSSDDTGAVSARSISLSPATNGECTSGRGWGGQRGSGSGAAGSQGGTN